MTGQRREGGEQRGVDILPAVTEYEADDLLLVGGDTVLGKPAHDGLCPWHFAIDERAIEVEQKRLWMKVAYSFHDNLGPRRKTTL